MFQNNLGCHIEIVCTKYFLTYQLSKQNKELMIFPTK